MVFLNSLLFYCNFILLVGWEQNGTIIFIFYLFQPFPTYLLDFSITCRAGTERNDNFYFLAFPAFYNLFWLEIKPQWYFLIFWLFYWTFLLRVGLERNGMITFIFWLSYSFPTYFGLKWILNDILYFVQFFGTFWEFSCFPILFQPILA